MVEQQTNIPAISSRERFSYGISKSLHSQLPQSLPQCLGQAALRNWAWGLAQGIKLDQEGTQCWGELQEQGGRLRKMNWGSRQVSTIDAISKCNYHQHINPPPWLYPLYCQGNTGCLLLFCLLLSNNPQLLSSLLLSLPLGLILST